jgi:hypothetical protein
MQLTEQVQVVPSGDESALGTLPFPREGDKTHPEREGMLPALKKWGIWFLGLGIVHLISPLSLSIPGGIVMVLIGLASFILKSPAMFVVFAASIGLSAVMNLTSGGLDWGVFGLIQIYMTIRTLGEFRQYRDIQSADRDLSSEVVDVPRIRVGHEKAFPWLSVAFGSIAFFSMIAFWASAFIGALLDPTLADQPNLLDTLLVGLIGSQMVAGELAISFGVASLAAKHRLRALSGIAIVLGSLSIGIILVLGHAA